MKINKNMTIARIIEINPDAMGILESYGLHCACCALGQMETLREGAAAHGLTEKEVGEIVGLLNGK